MDPDKIELENLSKSFEYYKLAADVDKMDSKVIHQTLLQTTRGSRQSRTLRNINTS